MHHPSDTATPPLPQHSDTDLWLADATPKGQLTGFRQHNPDDEDRSVGVYRRLDDAADASVWMKFTGPAGITNVRLSLWAAETLADMLPVILLVKPGRDAKPQLSEWVAVAREIAPGAPPHTEGQ